ncbi:MAG: shikimate dehydrogenase [Gammaproteobacteria bacterium]
MKKALFAVMGDPIEHSLSPRIHQLFAKQVQIALDYVKLQVTPKNFSQAIAHFRRQGGQGLNITAPLKKMAYDYVNQYMPRAQQAGVVNTIVWQDDRNRVGDNTDGAGLITDLQQNLHVILKNKCILLIGAGGAASGVLPALLSCQPKKIIVANRTLDHALSLIETIIMRVKEVVDVEHKITASDFVQLALCKGCFDVVINTTPVSWQHQSLPLSKKIFVKNNETVAYDLAYGLADNGFLRWAQSCGVMRCYDGLGMLVEQAAAAFALWHGVLPQTQPVIHRLQRLYSLRTRKREKTLST